jgi:hypothetical protein
MNRPTTMPLFASRPTPAASPWWESKLAYGDPIPTEYLGQLPANWPYHEFGARRKAGKITSWAFVNPNKTAKTVGWLYHSVVWNPRPLVATTQMQGPTTKGYDALLHGWKHEFLYETTTTKSSGPLVTTTTIATTSKMASLGFPTTTSWKSAFRPTQTQLPPLSKEADPGDLRLSMATSSKGGPVMSRMVAAFAVTNKEEARSASALSELWEQV